MTLKTPESFATVAIRKILIQLLGLVELGVFGVIEKLFYVASLYNTSNLIN